MKARAIRSMNLVNISNNKLGNIKEEDKENKDTTIIIILLEIKLIKKKMKNTILIKNIKSKKTKMKMITISYLLLRN